MAIRLSLHAAGYNISQRNFYITEVKTLALMAKNCCLLWCRKLDEREREERIAWQKQKNPSPEIRFSVHLSLHFISASAALLYAICLLLLLILLLFVPILYLELDYTLCNNSDESISQVQTMLSIITGFSQLFDKHFTPKLSLATWKNPMLFFKIGIFYLTTFNS